MDYTIKPETIEYCKQFLKDHPIDPRYDDEADTLDGDIPPEQISARNCYDVLKTLGMID